MGLDAVADISGVHLAHAATAVAPDSGATDSSASGNLLATGGRVLSVVARATSFGEARDRAYEAIRLIDLEGGQYRSDIAAAVVAQEQSGR
jgi:phosphoribosylamine--glycine ligase